MTTDKAREILGVKEGASSSEIEQAWSNWISIRHLVQVKERVKQINKAYETLKGKLEPTPQQASSKDSASMHFQENLIKMASIKEQLRRVEEGEVVDPKLTPHEESQKIAKLLNEYENLDFKNQQLLDEAEKILRPIETVNKKRLAQKYEEKRHTAEDDYLIYAYIELDHPHRCYVGQTLQSRA